MYINLHSSLPLQERSSKHLRVTCCSKQQSRQKTTIYVTTNPDWFDVASAIGALILQRCQLEDALLLSQLLESPLETLRYRGFPVDRILRPVSKPQPQPIPAPETKPDNQKAANGSVAKGKVPENNSSTPHHQQPSKGETSSGFESILKQMFPSCSPDTIKGLLGPNP